MKRRSVIMRTTVRITLLLLALTSVVSACSSSEEETQQEQEFTLAPESALSDRVRNAPPQVKEAYRFAIANPDLLSAFPCYCGCGGMGHMNNRDCYIKQVRSDGSIEFESHALG